MNCISYCDNYGNCCAATLPLTRREEKRIREYIKINNIEPEFFQTEKDLNLQCCFYDRKNKLCKIYEVRPSICRSFRCNKNINILEIEKEETHKQAYWNHITDTEQDHLIDMRLLFYGDPRSLIANILFQVTNGTMKVTKEHLEFTKKYLKENGQEKLSNCIEGIYGNEDE